MPEKRTSAERRLPPLPAQNSARSATGERVDVAGQEEAVVARSRSALGFVKPYKPISQMSDAERRAFAHELGNLMVAKMDAAKKAVERADEEKMVARDTAVTDGAAAPGSTRSTSRRNDVREDAE